MGVASPPRAVLLLQRADGLLDLDIYDFESAFGTGFGMDKRERLLYGDLIEE